MAAVAVSIESLVSAHGYVLNFLNQRLSVLQTLTQHDHQAGNILVLLGHSIVLLGHSIVLLGNLLFEHGDLLLVFF